VIDNASVASSLLDHGQPILLYDPSDGDGGSIIAAMTGRETEPLRREQILLSSAAVIAERGMAGMTMRAMAEHAGVSTGMLTHYFSNRADILLQTLEYVSVGTQRRQAAAIDNVPAGEERLRALLGATLPFTPESAQSWRVWIAAYGEAVHSPTIRNLIGGRHENYYAILERAVEGYDWETGSGRERPGVQFNAYLTGIVVRHITSSEGLLTREQMEADVMNYVASQARRSPRDAAVIGGAETVGAAFGR
jgi:TetR/AcrR family transcriptional regulator, transcriptional repressor of bet genes